MSYPGTNELKISIDAVKALVLSHAQALLPNARITSIKFDGYYSQPSSMTVEFTTDPLPVLVEVPKQEAA